MFIIYYLVLEGIFPQYGTKFTYRKEQWLHYIHSMKKSLFCLALVLCTSHVFSQGDRKVNYEEAKIPPYELPDPLVFEDGSEVKTLGDWKKRRAEILNLFETEVYGKAVSETKSLAKVTKTIPDFLGGKALMREVTISLSGEEGGPSMTMLLITPKNVEQAPTFLTMNFSGNHTILDSPEISITDSWMRMSGDVKKNGYVIDNKAQEAGRGYKASRWPVEKIIDAGVGLATIYYGDIDPDFDDGFENGVHAHFGKPDGPAAWGSIATWTWGLSRGMDFLEKADGIDPKRVAVMGHSRLGKTALWAGATDERFALVISNNSGCGGAALSRRRIGENVKRINTSFPHWFCDNFQKYNDKESELPIDQHHLIALIAPRMVYVASAKGDAWADPKGEFLSAKLASPVYELLGKPGIGGVSEQAAVNTPVGETIRYHVRTGKHDVTDFDWEQYLKAIKSL